jgi:hypothetical protein
MCSDKSLAPSRSDGDDSPKCPGRLLGTAGFTRNAVAHNGILDPGARFIARPVTPDLLARKVREAIDEWGRRSGPVAVFCVAVV